MKNSIICGQWNAVWKVCMNFMKIFVNHFGGEEKSEVKSMRNILLRNELQKDVNK